MPLKKVRFEKGLNTSADFLSMPEGQCMHFDDVVFDYNILKGRNSMTNISTASFDSDTSMMSTWAWQDTSFPTRGTFIYVHSQHSPTNHIYRSTANWTESDLTSPQVYTDVTGTSAPGNSPIVQDVLNGKLVVVNSEGEMAAGVFNDNASNGAALGGSPPSSPISVKQVNNYLFLIVSNSSRVYWSSASDPTTWPAANFIDFQTANGDINTALGSIGTDVIVFKGETVGKLSTTSLSISGAVTLGPFTTIFNSVGCYGPRALDNIDDGNLIFWDSKGEIFLTDGYTFQRLSDPPPPEPNIFPSIAGVVQGGSGYNSLHYYPKRREVWLYNFFAYTYILVYDTILKYWRKITGISIASCVGHMRVPIQYSNATHNNFMLVGNSGTMKLLVADDYLQGTSGNIKDASGATVTAVMDVSVLIPQNLSESHIYGVTVIYQPQSGTRATITIGYDNTYSSGVYTLSGAAKYRWDLTNTAFGHSSGQRPATMQVKFQTTQVADALYDIFVDEVLEA